MIKFIAKNTPLTVIKNAVKDDFNVIIDNADAQAIRAAALRNSLSWTPDRLVIVGASSYLAQISRDRVTLLNGATYTASEWLKYNATI